MIARKSLAVLLAYLLAVPAWGNPKALGNVTGSRSATVRGAALTPGSTVFDGDTIEVGTHGSARIALAGGRHVQVGENSQVSLTRTADRVRLEIDRGVVSFLTGQGRSLEAVLADATITSANELPAIGIVGLRSPDSAIIAAEKGTLAIRTEHDGRSVTLREGEGAEIKLVQDQPSSQSPEQEKNKKKHPAAGTWTAGKAVVFGAVLAGVATGISFVLLHGEAQLSDKDKGNAISPFRFP